MSPKKKEGFDDIFAATADAAAETKKRGNGRKGEPAAAPAPAAAAAFSVDLGAVLQTAWSNHEREALYRKAKEDRLLTFSLGLLAAIVFGAAVVLGAGRALDWNWIAKLIFRGASAAFVVAVTFALSAMIELNRKRLQDVLAMIVKIQEALHLFDDGAFPGADGAFLPNTYKFVGSMNDDETNYAQMILKVAAGAVIGTILLLV
jgi:hypothetical protein